MREVLLLGCRQVWKSSSIPRVKSGRPAGAQPRRKAGDLQAGRFAGWLPDLGAACGSPEHPPAFFCFLLLLLFSPKDSRRNVILLSSLGPKKTRFRKVVGTTGLQLLLVEAAPLASTAGETSAERYRIFAGNKKFAGVAFSPRVLR